MERRNEATEEEQSASGKTEAPMEILTVQETKRVTPVPTCAHQRLIDDVLTRDGKRTGKVRCLECGAVFADPYRGMQ
ncbi:MAG: hypothetical protein HY038_13985 [Nitrospirae bacterium]|nr:hypothetical protein [Nitrospirota bacterium]